MLEGIAGEKKVQGTYVLRTGAKKEIACLAPKQCICKNCPCTRHTHIEPPVLYHPLDRAKRVHYVSVKVKLTKAKMTNLNNFYKESWPRSAYQAPALPNIVCIHIFCEPVLAVSVWAVGWIIKCK